MLLQVVAVEQNGKQCHEVPEDSQNIRSLSELVNAHERWDRCSTSVVRNSAASFGAVRLYLPVISFVCLTVAEYCELIDELHNEHKVQKQNGKAPVVLIKSLACNIICCLQLINYPVRTRFLQQGVDKHGDRQDDGKNVGIDDGIEHHYHVDDVL